MIWRDRAILASALLLAATGAAAQWRDGRGGFGGDGDRGRAPRAFVGPEGGRGGGWGGGPERGAGRYVGGGYRGGWYPGGYPGGYSGGFGGGGNGAVGFVAGAAGGGWRRGQVLPPAYRGAYVPDPGRYHLRSAPQGYGWVGDGRNAYLTQRSTGMVLDVAPRAYEPPPATRGRGGRGGGRGPGRY